MDRLLIYLRKAVSLRQAAARSGRARAGARCHFELDSHRIVGAANQLVIHFSEWHHGHSRREDFLLIHADYRGVRRRRHPVAGEYALTCNLFETWRTLSP